jgi:hypothetical protein
MTCGNCLGLYTLLYILPISYRFFRQRPCTERKITAGVDSERFSMNPIPLKIAYIGGGSRLWARKLMIDIALCPDLTGEVALYDIDMDSARLNEQLGN